mmetsp:Transcript_97018/g.182454  ORF Transcript_97018/g.182454 Transcript_97018/m.182454 type:complete len:89 (+) Transcript_97018:1558-1824(+)
MSFLTISLLRALDVNRNGGPCAAAKQTTIPPPLHRGFFDCSLEMGKVAGNPLYHPLTTEKRCGVSGHFLIFKAYNVAVMKLLFEFSCM